MTHPKLDLWLKRADKLHAPSAVVVDLLRTLDDPNHSRKDIERLLGSDMRTSASVFRMANSPAYRQREQEIETIGDALALVGEATLTRTVIEAAAAAMQVPELPGYGMAGNGLWEHALRAAIAAEALARKAGGVPPSAAYTAGLFLDVGKVLLGPELETALPAILGRISENPGMPFDYAERAELGIDHAELGALLAERWSLPKRVVEAIRHHHRPRRATEHRPFVFIAHVADTLACMARPGASVDGLRYALDPQWSEHLSLGPHELPPLLLSIEVEVAAREHPTPSKEVAA